MTATSDFIIVGAGMTGLTAAYLAAKGGHKVTVLEGQSEPGGLLGTFPVGDTRLEHFYHHFFTHDAELNWLVHELGLGSRLRYLPGSMGIYRLGNTYPFNQPFDLLRFNPISPFARLRFAATSLFLSKFADWRKWEDISCLEWFQQFAGKEATDAIWRPMLEIKFGPYAHLVPAAWMVGRLRQRVSSRKHQGERLGYLEGSLSVLLDRLLVELKRYGVQVLTQHEVHAFETYKGRVVGVRTSRGIFRADEILATIPADQLAWLVEDIDSAYAGNLKQIKHFGAVCTVLEMDRPLGSYYWLNVADSGFPFGGVIEHTRLVPAGVYGGRHIVYLSRYFEREHTFASMPTQAIGESMIASLKQIYPNLRPRHILGTHVFRTNTAAFACDLGFSRTVPAMRTPIPGLAYAGMVHVYPDERSINNCIRVAVDGLQALGYCSSDVPRGVSLSGQAISRSSLKNPSIPAKMGQLPTL